MSDSGTASSVRISALYFRLEPLNRPPAPGGTFLVVWPDETGDGQYTHHAHPDRTVMDAEAGDVLVFKRRPYRVLQVKIYLSSLCWDESRYKWCSSVRECVETAV